MAKSVMGCCRIRHSYTCICSVRKLYTFCCCAFFATGAFDSVSVVIRSTLLQLLVPDNMRGRVNAINGIFLSTSNEVGAFESGLAAKIMGGVPSVIFGGAMTIIIVSYIFFKSGDLSKGISRDDHVLCHSLPFGLKALFLREGKVGSMYLLKRDFSG